MYRTTYKKITVDILENKPGKAAMVLMMPNRQPACAGARSITLAQTPECVNEDAVSANAMRLTEPQSEGCLAFKIKPRKPAAGIPQNIMCVGFGNQEEGRRTREGRISKITCNLYK